MHNFLKDIRVLLNANRSGERRRGTDGLYQTVPMCRIKEGENE